MRPALRPPVQPAAAELYDDDSEEITQVGPISVELACAPLDDSLDDDDPPTREASVDVAAMMRAVSCEGPTMPIDLEAGPTHPPPPPMPSMSPGREPTSRSTQPLIPLAPRLLAPPQFPAMRPQAVPSPPVEFAPLPALPPSFLSAPTPWRPIRLAPSSSPPPLATPSTPSSIASVPSIRHTAKRSASTWKQALWLLAIALTVASTILGVAHRVTGGAIWSP